MTPKSLLRKELSSLEELASGTFQRVIGDAAAIPASGVTRLILCSGKVYYDLAAARTDPTIGIARVEQLYPFPRAELTQLCKSMPKLKELFWVQEEPRNMGAWRFAFPLLTELAAGTSKAVTVGYVGRVERASPATGFLKTHELEQKLIVEEAMSRGTKNGH
jgi:2-oxoglutarate dehydrogenase E1 component